jgi:hypothetical protein
MEVEDIEWEGFDWINVTQERGQQQTCEHGNEHAGLCPM